MATLSDRWNRIRGTVTLADLLMDAMGKALMVFSLGFATGMGRALAMKCHSYSLEMEAVVIYGGLFGAGLALTVGAKSKYWRPFWK